MSEHNSNPPWLDAWVSMQQDFWQKMLSGQAPAAPTMPGPVQFMQFFGGSVPDSSTDVSRKMLEFGEGYLGVAREFWKLVQAVAPTGAPTDAERLQQELEKLRNSFTEGFAKLYGAPLGADLMSAWQRMGEAATTAMGAAGQQPSIPGLPPLGLTREKQEAMERLGRAALRYQQALAKFGELLARVSGDAVDRLSRRVVKRASGDAPIGSFRAMYDLWVESGEEAFAAAAHGADFARAQAELNDALMELRAEQQKQVEEWARSLDLPTRSEVNSIIKRIGTLKNRVRELEEEIEQLKRGRAS